MSPFWVTAFLDLPDAVADRGVGFWRGVTGYGVSAPRGDRGEFVSLVPPEGDPFLKCQRVADGQPRIHLDLHVSEPQEAADAAVALGARVTTRHDFGYVVLQSPAGLTFCFVTHPAGARPAPATWGGCRSLVDQVCLDIPAPAYSRECEFWRDLTGWEARASSVAPEFSSLVRPAGQPLRLLLQQVGDDGPMRAHLDLACDDRAVEAVRHEALGARLVGHHPVWTLLTDPTGLPYCITDRDPDTGLI